PGGEHRAGPGGERRAGSASEGSGGPGGGAPGGSGGGRGGPGAERRGGPGGEGRGVSGGDRPGGPGGEGLWCARGGRLAVGGGEAGPGRGAPPRVAAHALRLEVGGRGVELHCDTCELVVTHLAGPEVRRAVEEAHRRHLGTITWESGWFAVCSCGWSSTKVS